MAEEKHLKIKLKSRERLSLFSDLATMLMAGVPILDAVISLEADAKGNQKKILVEIRRTLNNGEPLSHVLHRLPQAFDPITVNLVQAAEAGGTLETTLRDIVVTTKKELAFSDQLRNTMIYPAFVMAVFTAIVVLMLTFVVPRIAKVFGSMHVHMPLVTRVMIRLSALFLAHWVVIGVGVIAFIVFAAYYYSNHKRAIARIVLSLPVLSNLGVNIDLTRFSRSFGLLMHAGVPVLEALDLSEQVIQKKQIAAIVQQMRRDVEAGKPLSSSLQHGHGIIPPIMTRSIQTAETTGTLEQTMQNLTEYFDEQVSESLKLIGSLVEPILLVLVGIMVGTLMITIIAPIYNLISQINPNNT